MSTEDDASSSSTPGELSANRSSDPRRHPSPAARRPASTHAVAPPDHGIADAVTIEAAAEASSCFLESLFDGLAGGDCCLAEASFGPDCFVATATMGPQHPDLDTLRAFRDRILRRSLAGRAFIAAYYRYGAHAAHFIADKPRLKRLVRTLLVRPTARLTRHLLE